MPVDSIWVQNVLVAVNCTQPISMIILLTAEILANDDKKTILPN